jgi:ribosomal protein S12 methylthiotransferase
MAASLLREGFCFASDPGEAEVIVLNTCAFIQEAVQESLDAVQKLLRHKRQGLCRCLVVAGCLVQRFKNELIRRLPEVDLFVGLPAMGRIGPILTRFLRQGGPGKLFPSATRCQEAKTRISFHGERLVPGLSAYVKIAEGCSNHCSYCTLPQIRGPMRSRRPAEILDEVARLADHGVLEINLVAQDVAAYGRDRGSLTSLPLARLLRKIDRIRGVRWIRLLYCHPAHVDEELIRVMGDIEKICPYLDLPIQHVSKPVLKAMRRNYGCEDLLHLIDRLRRARPDLALRTTVMVGFPGEKKKDFEKLMRFLQEVRFHHVGAFCYSPEPQTAAYKIRPSVPPAQRRNRYRAVLELQSRISRELQREFVGTLQEVIVEGAQQETGRFFQARTRFQAPEVDGIVWIHRAGSTPTGLAQVRITGARTYDLVGRISSNPSET